MAKWRWVAYPILLGFGFGSFAAAVSSIAIGLVVDARTFLLWLVIAVVGAAGLREAREVLLYAVAFTLAHTLIQLAPLLVLRHTGFIGLYYFEYAVLYLVARTVVFFPLVVVAAFIGWSLAEYTLG
ncbi:hypothetical protein DRN94_002710 [archaeon]|nr:hypothetical protein [archaeon]